MGNDFRPGLHITPLTLWVAGALGGALWAVLFAIGLSILSTQRGTQESVATLVTSQVYDRREIDAIKTDVKDVRADVRVLSERVGKVESRR